MAIMTFVVPSVKVIVIGVIATLSTELAITPAFPAFVSPQYGLPIGSKRILFAIEPVPPPAIAILLTP